MSSQRIWTDQHLANPHEAADKSQRVQAMFAAIAKSYDLNNRLHSMGRDQMWRREAVRMAQLTGRERVLDVACGTGDLTLAFADEGAGQVLGLDFTFDMLALAMRKRRRRKANQSGVAISFHAGDAMRLPLRDECVDVVSIAFGIRNVTDPATAVREFARVLSPGGRLIILEFSMPRNRLFAAFYRYYFLNIMPRTASLIASDRTGAYYYLPRSVNTFLDQAALLELLHKAGFTQAVARPVTFGIAVIYRAIKGEMGDEGPR